MYLYMVVTIFLQQRENFVAKTITVKLTGQNAELVKQRIQQALQRVGKKATVIIKRNRQMDKLYGK